MARVKLLADGEVPADVQAMFDAASELNGRLANSMQAFAHSPAILQWIVPLSATIQKDGLGCKLDAQTRALAMIRVSELNRCQY